MSVSKILISGCGLSWSGQERPTWVNVLKLCGVDIDDQAGPAISNQLILNNMIENVIDNSYYKQAICQLTSTKKLDIELTNQQRKDVAKQDTIRNFTYKNYWPSSVSKEHSSKKIYYEYLHSPSIEESDIIYKWLLLKRLCDEKNIKLHTVMGYKINWNNKRHKLLNTNHDYAIYDDYEKSKYYKLHDHSLGEKNTVPNKYFSIYLARKLNSEFLHLPIEEKLKRFHD
jgi:hypothetical protein